MNKFKGILVLGVLASVSAGAWAKDNGVKVARDQAKATYEMDKRSCEPLGKKEKKDCLRRAKAEYAQQVGEVRDLEKAEEKQDKAARAEKKNEKRRLSAHSGGDRSYEASDAREMRRASAGAQGDASKPTASPVETNANLFSAPVSANSPN